MTIGASLFLIVVGAILYFATNWRLAEVDLDIVGLILMIAGAVGLILGFMQQRMGRRVREVEVTRDPNDPPGY